MIKQLRISFILILLAIAGVSNVSAQDTEEWRYIPGLVFSTSNLLLDLDSYQGGVGFSLNSPRDTWRFSVGIGYESSSDAFFTQLGTTYTRPFFTTRVSPYWGGSIIGGYQFDSDELDADNWTRTNEISVFLGGLLGVEFIIDPRISFFAEYSLGLEIAWVTLESSVAGVVTSTGSNNWSFGTELGNSGSIGVIIYLDKGVE